ncbi:N-acetylglucosamine-6-phosphate deacetylase [Ruminococcaceae bacterium OttesenSCG-928-D13]|nr:N-acetylglucosamine-6-phosphate deacetylase [Ruminococcaceae bacterium OttesenSCG-928-D13]
MVINNGLVFGEDCLFKMADLAYEDGVITQVAAPGSLPAAGAIDAGGGYVLPGFVDIHSHGCVGGDFCDASGETIEKMLAWYGSQGVTSVVPATMSYNEAILNDILDAAMPYFDAPGHGAVLRGVNMEGPFLNTEKRGAQNPTYIMDPAVEMFGRLYDRSKGYIKLVDIAPELPGSLEFIRAVCGRCAVSLAHTNAGYDDALAAFEAGASHVTHLFNAMPPFLHRDPGVIGAASDRASHVEIVSDGIHLHPAVVRAVFQWFGAGRVCLVSDSMRGTGMPDGEYDLGGQMVKLEGSRATLVEGGAIAGSATGLAECCRKAIGFGVPIEQAVRAATLNPAKAAGIEHEVGSLMPGKQADIVIWNRDLQPAEVIVGGRRILN